MKKNFKKISLIVCLAAGAMLLFTACAGFSNTKLSGQDTSYAVLSNGGSAVQYGDYVYFVNGTISGFDDSKGDQNVWGEVEKGGIYRVKIGGGTPDKKVKEVLGTNANGTDVEGAEYKIYGRNGQDFTFQEKTEANFDEDETLLVNIDSDTIERVVPKYITFSNDTNAGIFIFDGWIYYSSPANRKNKSGTVEYTLSDFYRTKVDGQGTQLLYTSGEAVKSYNFYKYNNLVYLVTFEGENLISLPINNKKAGRTTVLTDGITEVMFPHKQTYFSGISQDTASDYIYYTRAFTKDDSAIMGNVMECRRPDLALDTSMNLGDNNNTYALLSVDNNTLFFYETQATGSVKSLIAKEYDRTSKDFTAGKTQVIRTVTDAMTGITAFAGKATVNIYSALTVEGTVMKWYQGIKGQERADDGAAVSVATVASGSVIFKIDGARVYFSNGAASALFCIDLSYQGVQTPTQLTKGNVATVNNMNPDFAADMVWFLGESIAQKDFTMELRSETITANYMYVKSVMSLNLDAKEYFVGKVGEGDLPEEEE